MRELWAREIAAPLLVRIVAALMVLDALLLIAHVLHRSGSVLDSDGSRFRPLRSDALWNGGVDGSLMELFGLLQLGAAALLLLSRGVLEPAHRVLAAWGGVFLLLIADDLLRIHERVGARLALDRLVPSLGATTAQELGGLVFWAVSGLVLVGGMIRLHHASAPAARAESRVLLATAVPFAVVAVGYVLLGVVRPGLFNGPWGEVAALIRITVKLLTMTILLVQALRIAGLQTKEVLGAEPPAGLRSVGRLLSCWLLQRPGHGRRVSDRQLGASSLSTSTPWARSFL